MQITFYFDSTLRLKLKSFISSHVVVTLVWFGEGGDMFRGQLPSFRSQRGLHLVDCKRDVISTNPHPQAHLTTNSRQREND